ncbi:hypothetical protein MRX96_002426 [Rhipicephalus microplus]
MRRRPTNGTLRTETRGQRLFHFASFTAHRDLAVSDVVTGGSRQPPEPLVSVRRVIKASGVGSEGNAATAVDSGS